MLEKSVYISLKSRSITRITEGNSTIQQAAIWQF